MKRISILLVILFSCYFLVFGQETGKQGDTSNQTSLSPIGQETEKQGEASKQISLSPQAQPSQETILLQTSLAKSNPSYRVTPGDLYQLAYLSANQQVTLPLTVESDYSVNLGFFGKLKAEDLSFVDFKRLVEQRVTNAYPNSSPILTIVSVGKFQVYLRGEVDLSTFIIAWGLTRLSEIIKPKLTRYSSIRDVQIINRNGSTKTYDLFRAERFGESASDPYLKSGDTIVVGKAERRVNLLGEIRRPGTYQLLKNDTLKDLMDSYGDGATIPADISRVRVDRLGTAASKVDPVGETIYIDLASETAPGFVLKDLDTISVPTRLELRPVVFFEGAIISKKELPAVSQSNRIPYNFMPGERISSPVVYFNRSGFFTAESALEKSYIIRVGEAAPITIDLQKILYDYSPANDRELHNGDYIVIPFRQYFITVGGAVKIPGRYPYVPNRSWRYYVNLAGGFDGDKNIWEALEIRDINDQMKSKEQEIQPEDKIVAISNNPLDVIGKFSPIITTISSLISVIVSYTYLTR